MGEAARKAAVEVRAQLLDIASNSLEVAATDLEVADGVIRAKDAPDRSLTVREAFRAKFGNTVGSLFGAYDYQTVGALDPVTGKGKASAYWFFSAAGAEVEVDRRTGKVRVIRAVVGGRCRQGHQPASVLASERRIHAHRTRIHAVRGDVVRQRTASER
jgi:CO/xanthine dehydrogenase Mo-binding subunit